MYECPLICLCQKEDNLTAGIYSCNNKWKKGHEIVGMLGEFIGGFGKKKEKGEM